MKIEDKVCSLELSKKLLTLGVEQNSFFYWVHNGHEKYEVIPKIIFDAECNPNYKICDAFMASELLTFIPNNVKLKNCEPFDNYRIFITRFNSVDENMKIANNFIVNYECDSTEATGENAWLRRKLTSNIFDPNLANALATMLIYILENGVVEND